MQAFVETAFDTVYLLSVITLGIIMLIKGKKLEFKLFGVMAITLGLGDSFHLVPRAYALLTTGLEDYTFALGLGKFITSITMTFFYLILYHVWRIRYKINGKHYLTIAFYLLALIRIILCLLPGNNWTSSNQPLSYGIYRNIPFAMIGLLIIILFFKSAKDNKDKNYKFMWLTIVLSFLFYIPVVLFADKYPLIGMLMIPKTCAYVWTVVIGFNCMRKENQDEKI